MHIDLKRINLLPTLLTPLEKFQKRIFIKVGATRGRTTTGHICNKLLCANARAAFPQKQIGFRATKSRPLFGFLILGTLTHTFVYWYPRLSV